MTAAHSVVLGRAVAIFVLLAGMATGASALQLSPEVEDSLDVMAEIEVTLAGLGYELDTAAVPVVGLGPAEWRAALHEQISGGLPDDQWEALARFAAAVDGAPGSIDAEQIVELATDSGNGSFMLLYDILTGSIIHRNGVRMIDSVRMNLLTHELVHAHQDLRVDLSELGRTVTTLDQLTVLSCLREGEADLVAMAASLGWERAIRNAGAMRSQFNELHWAGGAGALQYGAGAMFASSVWEASGADGLRAALQDLPTSTEQVLHPLKLGRDLPTPVVLPELDLEPAAFSVAGEVTLLRMLSALATPQSTARFVASGWDGDRIGVYEDGDVVIWRILWDRPDDAHHFRDVWSQRAPGKTVVVGRRTDWIVSLIPALTTSLASLAEADPWMPEMVPEDAASTYAQEAWRQQDHAPVAETWPVPDSRLVMDMPTGWGPRRGGGQALLEDKTPRSVFTPRLEVRRRTRVGAKPLEDWLPGAVTRISPRARLIERGTLGEYPRVDAHIPGNSFQDVPQRSVWIAAEEDGDALVISLRAAESQWPELQADLEAALASLRPGP